MSALSALGSAPVAALAAEASSDVTPTLLASAPAIVLAVVAAGCFAVAASLQHGAVDDVTDDGKRLGLAAFRALLRRPGWLIGLATAGAGSALHAVALVLSPLAVVQPIGVLAVPIAVLLTVRRTQERPGRGVLLGVALCVVGVAAFVVIAASSTTSTRVPDFATLIAGGISLALVLVLVAVAMLRTGWIRCVAWVTAGAVAFGLVSALVRALSLQVTTGLVGFTDPRFLATAAGIAVALGVGGWLVQQGFATGAPEVVIACLTVVDPIVAVLLGIVLLGEGPATNGVAAVVLVLCALAASAGVVSLARYHPDARRARAEARAAARPAPRP
ncbi:MAG: DMT family transporter [Pseudonocardiales bacterium]|nr:DMT family transporter [Pseudonocardiales bacterium]